MFKINEINAIRTGIFVNFLEKKVGIKIFISIKNGSPNAKTSRLNEVFKTSRFVNSHLKKIVVTICSAQKYIPIHEGKPISSTIF